MLSWEQELPTAPWITSDCNSSWGKKKKKSSWQPEMVGECAAYSRRDDITEAPKLQPLQASGAKISSSLVKSLTPNIQSFSCAVVGFESELLIFKKPRDHDENDDFGLNMRESVKTVAFKWFWSQKDSVTGETFGSQMTKGCCGKNKTEVQLII